MSTASTRPLYGWGAGSNPAGGSASQRTLVAQRTRAPPCEGGGRWFESSRAYSRGRSSQRESAGSPARRGPFDSGRPLSKAPGVTESMASSNLAGPGSTPGGPVHHVAGRSGSVISGERREPAVRIRSRPHATTATTPPAAGQTVPVIDQTHRQVAGSSPARGTACPGSSAGRAVPGQPHDRSSIHNGPRAERERLSRESARRKPGGR